MNDDNISLLIKRYIKTFASSLYNKFYTKNEVDDLIENIDVDTTNLATKEELNDIIENVQGLTSIPEFNSNPSESKLGIDNLPEF